MSNIATLPEPSSNHADNAIIQNALDILATRIQQPETYITSPDDTKAFLQLRLSEKQHEIFSVMFLDNRHGLIKYEEMFRGTIDGASVHPREVVKAALSCNASAVIFAHNHPSGVAEPSKADENITKRLQDALSLVDVRVLDHIIVGNEVVSFAERGIL